MTRAKLKFLFIQPHWDRYYVPFLPVYEPLHGLILDAVARPMVESVIFDRRFDSDRNLVRLVKDFQPDLVGATAHTSAEIFNVMDLLQLVKNVHPSCTTIVGGQHATLLPEDYFHPAVDIICIGPAEETFRETVEALLAGDDLAKVPGLVVKREEGDYVVAPPRIIKSGYFSWPPFDRSILSSKYRRHYRWTYEMRPNIYTITTSGCPYRCKFCSLWVTQRGVYRKRRPEEIVEDIASQPQTFVHLTDDNTFHDEDHALAIYELMKKRGLKKKILAYARTDTIVEKSYLLEKWKEIGLEALVVGMEAVSDDHLDALNKRTSLDENIEAHKIMERLGIENWAHFVLMPEFEKEDFDRIWHFVDTLNVTYPIFVPMTPLPGTPLFFEAKEKGELTVFDYGFYNLEYMVMRTKIPKDKWYEYALDLYRKSCSWRTLAKRRKSPAFHFVPALGRAFFMSRSARRIRRFMEKQVEMEKTIDYDAIEHTLPPSLRRSYKPDKYYNAPSMFKLKEAASAAV